MSKITDYRQRLKTLKDWTPFLLKESGLPGARANLELAQAVAEEGNKRQFAEFLASEARANSPEEFVFFCGVVGLGMLAARGKQDLFARLRKHASDPRWRVREAVAMGLQIVGDADMSALLKEMQAWSKEPGWKSAPRPPRFPSRGY